MTWREKYPDKYREYQRETMRRRRAAAKPVPVAPVSEVERVAVTEALRECEARVQPVDAIAGQPMLDQPVTGPVGRVDVPPAPEPGVGS